MNKEEIKKEFEKTFQTEVGTKGSRRVWGTATDVWNFFEPLIQESNREVLVGFIKWQWEMGMCGVMDNSVVEEYLSSIGKDK